MQAGYRTLAILKMLQKYSDEDHPMNAVEIAERLREHDVEVERRSIYRSIEELEQHGVDIVHVEQKTQGFYLASREFELPEIKLLMDAVQAARFIPGKKSRELVNKLASFASNAQAEALLKSVFIEDRAKCDNAQIYYNIDKIYTAIRSQKQIGFQYCEYDLRKRRVARKGGAQYTASPYSLEWNNDAYYLISRIGTLEKFTHFRVDRMKDIKVLDDAAIGYKDLYGGNINLSEYGTRALSMFEGPMEEVHLRFKNYLVTTVIDRLGAGIPIFPENDEWFSVHTPLVVSPGLTAWLAHFGGNAEVVAPAHARAMVRDALGDMLSRYETDAL